MNEVRTMVGTALLWVGLAALVYVPTSGGGAKAAIVAVLGFVAFAGGLRLFGEGLKREIVTRIRDGR